MIETSTTKTTNAATVIGIITLILALVAVSLLLLLPAAGQLLLSFQNYKPQLGMTGSPWVGLQNYTHLFDNPVFLNNHLLWSLTYASLSGLFLFALSVPAGYLAVALGRVKWLRHALCTLLLLPIVVPGELWAQAFVSLFGMKIGQSLPLLALWSALKYLGLPLLLVTAAVACGKRSWPVPILAGGVAALAMAALLGRFDFTFLRQFNAGLLKGQIADMFILQTSLMNASYSLGAAAGVIRTLASAVLLALVAWPVALMLRRLFPQGCKPDATRIRDRLISLIFPAGAAALAAIALVIVVLVSGWNNAEPRLYANYPIFIAIALFGAAFNTMLCYLLARPLACAGKAGKRIMTVVLLLFSVLGISAIPIGEFLLFRSLGMFNTWFAVAFSGLGSVWGVWALAFAAKGMGVSTSADWFKRMWKPAIAMFAVQAGLLMNNTAPSHLYMARADSFHPLVAIYRVMGASEFLQNGVGINMALAALVTLIVPVALLLIVRTIFDEKESLGLFLPGK